jgi:hypothetical protein
MARSAARRHRADQPVPRQHPDPEQASRATTVETAIRRVIDSDAAAGDGAGLCGRSTSVCGGELTQEKRRRMQELRREKYAADGRTM